MILRKILLIFTVFVLISSCQDTDMYEKDKLGSLTLSFVQPSDDLINSLENNRTSSQLADVDQVRITLSGEAPTTLNIINGTASYSRSGLPVGTISVRVDLLGGGVNKYTQSKSVTIVANQNVSASFNAFTVTNQTINFTSSLDSTYDIGDDIILSWTNTHADQPVNIERWDVVGGTWVKTATLADDFVGNSGTWNTQSASQGETVKVRIQSTISNSFADSATFQLLGEQDNSFYIEYRHNGQPTFFNDVITLNDGNILASGRYGSQSDRHALLVKFDVNDGSVIATEALSSQSEFRGMTLGHNGEVLVTGYNIGSNTEVVLGAYNHDLSQIALVSHANPGGESRGAYSIDTYTYNGVDYILTAGEFQPGDGNTFPGLFMFDANYNYLTTWYYNDAEGKFLTVNVYNGTDVWLVGSDQDIDGTSQYGKNAAELSIFDNMDTSNVNVVRNRAAWGDKTTVNIEGTIPAVLSVDGNPEGDFYYAGGQYYDTNGVSGPTTDYRWQYYDFVLDSENGNEAVFVGNMYGCDANGDGILNNADGICAEIAIVRNNTTFKLKSAYISQSTSKSEASWAKFNAIDKIDSGYVVAGSNLITTFSTNYTGTKGLIAVVDLDGELRTVDDTSLLGKNIGINNISNVQTTTVIKSNKVFPR